ncbi:MAG: amino acid carrier protein [Oscillospiraceae bacterium]|nr:amino acid carrier protein [Oscillospiraceae bacterium]
MNTINEYLGGFSVVLIIVFGLVLSIKTKFFQGKGLLNSFRHLSKTKKTEDNSLTTRQAMCTSLAATIGTGNVVGISGAIAIGGAGVVFWIWISSFVCMIIKYCEIYLSMHYRRKEAGQYKGGIMYLAKILPPKLHFLGFAFAFFTIVASFGTGNLIQINTAVESFKNILPKDFLYTDTLAIIFAITLALLIGFTLISGIKKVSGVCEKLVPFMLILYLAASLFIIIKNLGEIPAAISEIFEGAFNPKAVTGGVVSSFFIVLRTGAVRGIISNESGLGTASLTHSAADNQNISAESEIGILEVFIDTAICTLTAIVILVSRMPIFYGKDMGLIPVNDSFYSQFGIVSSYLLSLFLILFAVSSVLGWGAYGIVASEFLWKKRGRSLYKIVFAAACVLGAVLSTEKIWVISEIFNSLMAIPNIIILTFVLRKFGIAKHRS